MYIYICIYIGKSVSMEIKKGRQAYLLCMEGSCEVTTDGGKEGLLRHDAAEIVGPLTLVITPLNSSTTASPFLGVHVLVVEMKFAGDGRTDL
jgi:hypothetical protein